MGDLDRMGSVYLNQKNNQLECLRALKDSESPFIQKHIDDFTNYRGAKNYKYIITQFYNSGNLEAYLNFKPQAKEDPSSKEKKYSRTLKAVIFDFT